MNEAKKLLQFGFKTEKFCRTAFKVEDGQLRLAKLSESLMEIEKKHSMGTPIGLRPEDIQLVYRRFIQTSNTGAFHRTFSDKKTARKLAWALTYSEKHAPYDQSIASHEGRLVNALGVIRVHCNERALFGVFNALLQEWHVRTAGLIRAFLRTQLGKYVGRRKSILKLKASTAWYCDQKGATQLALSLHRDMKKLAEIWTYLELPSHMNSYSYFGFVAEAYVAINRNLGRSFLEDIVQFIKIHNDDKRARTILARLIEILGIEASEHLRQPVQTFALQSWQDPRITGAAIRWRGISDNAVTIFKHWITKDDLRFFFDLVAKACDDDKFQHRKDFWMTYLSHIVFCRPVLRSDVERILGKDPEALQYTQTRRPAKLKGGTQDQHAFIIQMQEHTFVEFSTAGACYVYRDGNRPFPMDAKEYRMDLLRNREKALHRVIHSSSKGRPWAWQERFSAWIYQNLGVRPSFNSRTSQ